MRSNRPSLRSHGARLVAVLALTAGAACFDGEPVIEERGCGADTDCYQGIPCLVDLCQEGRCVVEAITDALPGGGDHDQDGRCDAGDADDDDDGLDDIIDDCPFSPDNLQVDYDGDGCFDGEDDDDDDDGVPDVLDRCDYSVRLDDGGGRFVSGPLNDVDGDGCADGIDNRDADDDGVDDGSDLCPFEPSSPEADYDADGCADDIDDDDDNDGRPDDADDCPRGDLDWFSSLESDHDRDGCRDQREDTDDDNDGVPDDADGCDETPIDVERPADADLDQDGCDDDLEDPDDDNDGVPDVLDACPRSLPGDNPGDDHDRDGCSGDADPDDDNDGVPDVDDRCTDGRVTNWQSFAVTDNDGDGCRDADEDDNDDDDGVVDAADACPLNPALVDTDGDGCDDDLEDTDDDGDGVPDDRDACPRGNPDEPGAGDHDGDGCTDGGDDDDDDDGVPDEDDQCPRGAPGRRAVPALDYDGDGCIDGREDPDDDDDGRFDEEDRCPVGARGWSSLDPDADHDRDGCRDADEDPDDDDDGVPDADDCAPLDASRAPGLPEACDGADNDCDGGIDEGARQTYFADRDGDGFGDPESRSRRCPGANGFVLDGTDCDDDDPEANPRDGCPGPVGTRDGRWTGPVSVEVFALDREDRCVGTLDLSVQADEPRPVVGSYTCRFEGPFADRDAQLGDLTGVLSDDELGAEGIATGMINGGFVLIFDGPDHAIGVLGGQLGAFENVTFEAYFELGRGGAE